MNDSFEEKFKKLKIVYIHLVFVNTIKSGISTAINNLNSIQELLSRTNIIINSHLSCFVTSLI